MQCTSYFHPAGLSRMSTFAILPALIRLAYNIVGKAEMPNCGGLIITTATPIRFEVQKALGLEPLEDL